MKISYYNMKLGRSAFSGLECSVLCTDEQCCALLVTSNALLVTSYFFEVTIAVTSYFSEKVISYSNWLLLPGNGN